MSEDIDNTIKTEQGWTEEDQVHCTNCGNDTFKVFMRSVIDYADLICAKCGAENNYQ